ncbi:MULTISPECIES: type II secretion system F family protein [unclassified Thioalkalivibrio]|uniref:type II secretion system F family protein n=1 Tax=unclassified Thioalkalivibrio TaxID=2621013 RepID=UPI00037C8C6C|nr:MULTISPECIES: type II secretion system F family protein [unclassified Thioalkalivibrio]
MALFNYRARSSTGSVQQGQLEADSPAGVARRLMSDGATPLEIRPASDASAASASTGGPRGRKRKATGRPRLDDLELFVRQMHSLTRAGVPIVRGLGGVAETSHNARLADAVGRMADALEAGRELWSAMRDEPKVFSPLMVNMVRMGESTGRLEETFQQLAFYLERERETRQQIKQAVRYPIFVLVAIAAAFAIINVVVIPAFAGMFERFGAELPLPTRILMATSDFTVAYWPWMLGITVAVTLGFLRWIRTQPGRLWWDRVKLSLPIVGSIIERALLARFARAMTMASRSGIPVLDGLEAVGRAVDNAWVENRVDEMRANLERGESLIGAAAGTGMFTPLVLQMIAVGEETGQVDDMMEEVARFYEQEVDYELKTLSSSIEPLLIGIIGAMVLILALGVFLPMWDLGAAAL